MTHRIWHMRHIGTIMIAVQAKPHAMPVAIIECRIGSLSCFFKNCAFWHKVCVWLTNTYSWNMVFQESERNSEINTSGKETTMSSTLRFGSIIFIMLLAFGTMTPAVAQDSDPSRIGDAKLEMAATAYKEISGIYNQLQENLQQVEGQEQRAQIEEQANQMMVQAVKNSGLTIDDYNDVMAQVRENPEEAERFNEKLTQTQ